METRPSWLDNLIFLIPIIGVLISTLFGVPGDATGETAGLLAELLSNVWMWGVSVVMAVRGVINSIKRWRQDQGLVVNGVKLYVRNPVGSRTV